MKYLRLISILMMVFCLQSLVFSQSVSITVKDAPLSKVLSEIRKKTGIDIIGEKKLVDAAKLVTVNVKNIQLSELLRQLERQQEQTIGFSLRDNTIMLRKLEIRPVTKTADRQQYVCFAGTVTDSLARPIQGVTVRITGISKVTAIARKGNFSFGNVESDATVGFSCVGYFPFEVKASVLSSIPVGQIRSFGSTKVLRVRTCEYKVILSFAADRLEEVEVNTGMFSRKQESFTGVTKTYSGDKLREVNRTSLLEALNTLDPSFKLIRDNNLGSDPNQTPKIEFRGTRGVPEVPDGTAGNSQALRLRYEQDPNQPLFILNGFEATLKDIIDLDINRIQSITLLKDAASTALYGPKSANGVVVVEMMRPKPGKLQIGYTTTGTIEAPDVSGYNLMNSQELLAFEEASRNKDENFLETYKESVKHDFRANQVAKGVNTDWLNVPLRNAYSMNHSLNIDGGDEVFSYLAGISKQNNKGVMKGSSTSSMSGIMQLSYRKDKFNISTSFRINDSKSEGSPYGSYSTYTGMAPYFAKFDAQGNLNTDRYLVDEEIQFVRFPNNSERYQVANPLFNAQLPFKNVTNILQFTNNLQLQYDIFPWLRFSAGGQFQKNQGTADFFLSPLNTMFDDKPVLEKGNYSYSKDKSTSYDGNAMLTFNRVIANKHIINANLRGSVTSNYSDNLNIAAIGFAGSADPLIFLANGYAPSSKPNGQETISRSLGLTGSINYSYDRRYNMDFSYNRSGSSSFGVENPFKDFYSVGLGWNIGNEKFLKKFQFVDIFRLSGNVGITGNESAGGFGSRTTYRLNNETYRLSETINLVNLANPNLEWASTLKYSYSLTSSFFKGLFGFTLSGFYDKTDPMIVQLPKPPSLGISQIPTNIGRLTTHGMELTGNVRLIQSKDWTWNLGLQSTVFLRSKYSGLGDKLADFTEAARKSNFLLRFSDGGGPYDIWAVRSVGINPADGQEILLTKSGAYTSNFNVENEVMVGTSRPKTEGVINTQVRYKLFTLSLHCRYIVGETKFNTALYNKVEEAYDVYPGDKNYDRRAFYDRWKNPGDDVAFLGVGIQPQGMSDRFLLSENALFFESVGINYDFNTLLKKVKMSKLGIKRLNVSLNLNNLFRFQFSNIKLERGLEYPFSRRVSFQISTSF
ncbi:MULTISPECIES: SusC/RagA family TonB-linked outer membrane protein [unclassified Sphingobacterium]|uniref:SusC/RagA family TonB-linked outer membrane protein n=1 Tax=unclassified Sphingobacterium TaxID=2609468 RepID=UPI00104C5E0A|nr:MULTISPECIES: SusC/RagA family TonB-linked outer membrane protein [unclassified Sphingobacterium]MCS3556553.1 TonB-linked SusC/RagA family outer membrane protein [Sphingobacterium sp. JUb21]TCQ99849.1 TonB-linked SusC/RagA family outer membrane protein [Sphingobacterium sp. JUb20]